MSENKAANLSPQSHTTIYLHNSLNKAAQTTFLLLIFSERRSYFICYLIAALWGFFRRNKKKKNPIKWGFSKVFLKQFTNVLRTPRYDKIGILEWFCCIRVALPKLFRTTQIVIKIIYTTLNSSIFLFFWVFLPPL